MSRTSKSVGIAIFRYPVDKDGNTYEGDFVGDYYRTPHVLLVEQYGKTWSIPKGHIEKDESCLDCAKREVKEEVGLDPTSYQIILDEKGEPIKNSFKRPSKGGRKELKHIVQYFAISFAPMEDALISTPEKSITDYGWCSIKEAKSFLHKPDHKALKKLYQKGMWGILPWTTLAMNQCVKEVLYTG